MLIYLAALPIWNGVLPLYAFWHFDDFSWGQTRKIQGSNARLERSGHDGGGATPSQAPIAIPMVRWLEWEREKHRYLQQQERQHQFPPTSPNHNQPPSRESIQSQQLVNVNRDSMNVDVSQLFKSENHLINANKKDSLSSIDQQQRGRR